MNWFTRIGAFFLLCLFSLQTLATTSFDFSQHRIQKNSNHRHEQFLQLQSSNAHLICQKVFVLAVEKIDQNNSTSNFFLDKLSSTQPVSIADRNKLSKSKKSFAYVKAFLFDSVQIIFPFHNFW